MKPERVVLQVVGTEEDEGHVRLAVFLEELQNLSAALRRAGEIAADAAGLTDFRVVGLSHSSPATITLEPKAQPQKPDYREKTLTVFREALSAIDSEKLTKIKVDDDLLVSFRELSRPLERKLGGASISVDDHKFEMSFDYVRRIDKALAACESCYGSIEGMLEKINVHGDANSFTIYPPVGPTRVACKFGPSIKEQAISAVGRRVSVCGRMLYRRDAPFPHEIEVDSLDIFGSIEELPNLNDLRGIAPDATGSQSSEEFIGELRSAWC